jgi:hypothetical protein
MRSVFITNKKERKKRKVKERRIKGKKKSTIEIKFTWKLLHNSYPS